MIQYNRGRIHILNVDLIRQSACECQDDINSHYRRIFASNEGARAHSPGLEEVQLYSDILPGECDDMRNLPLPMRKTSLAHRADGIFVASLSRAKGADLFGKACEFGLDGLVSTRIEVQGRPELDAIRFSHLCSIHPNIRDIGF